MVQNLKLFGYTRVSTKNQVDAPGGLNAQVERLQKWCEMQGHQLLDIYTDASVSAIDQRPAFDRLIEDLAKGKADGVVVTKLDRFGRSVQDLVEHTAALEDRKQHFISIGDSIDTSTANGRLLFHVLAAFAEFERDVIRERMQAGRERAEAMGTITHRPRTKLVDEKDLKQLQRLYNRGVSIASLARIFEVSRGTIYKRLVEMKEI